MGERIDITQFEGIGEWVVEERPDGSYAIKTGRDNSSLEEAETIAKLPTLIAELKKMYAREDELLDALRFVKNEIRCFTKFANDASQ